MLIGAYGENAAYLIDPDSGVMIERISKPDPGSDRFGNSVHGINNNHVVIGGILGSSQGAASVFQVVPEPSTMVLFIVACGCCITRRR